jgi:hypothetical protein
VHLDHERWRSTLSPGKHAKRFFDPIRADERPVGEPALQPTPAVVDDGGDAHSEVEADRDSKRIESRSEIRDRRGDNDGVAGAETRAYALHSPSMTSGLKA